jgi:hypothetical protein
MVDKGRKEKKRKGGEMAFMWDTGAVHSSLSLA